MQRIEDIFSDILESKNYWFPCQGEVQSFDATLQTASIRPAITLDGEPAPILESVPVLLPAGGGWEINLHLAAGDQVLLIFCGREMYRWAQGFDGLEENTHPKLGNAIALPCLPRNPGRTAGTTVGLTLRKSDGSVSLTLSDSGLATQGDLTVTGSISATGSIMATGLVTALFGTPGQVGLSTHTHSASGMGPPNPGT